MRQTNQSFWRGQARRLALRANFGFWFARWAPATAVVIGVAAPILLLARRTDGAARVGGSWAAKAKQCQHQEEVGGNARGHRDHSTKPATATK